MDDIPIQVMGGLKLAEVEASRLFQEFGLGRVCSVITKRDEHSSRKIDDLTINLKHPGSSLDLRLKTVRRRAKPINSKLAVENFRLKQTRQDEHHQGTSELEQELLS